MNIIKKKHPDIRKQTHGYQCGKRREEGQDKGTELRGTNYYVLYKLQGYIVQYRQHSQYFIITINGV